MSKADLIISATASPGFIFSAEDMKRVAAERKGRKLLIVDLALPRDIDPAVREFDGVLLYDLEDLERAVEPRIELRVGEAEAEKIVTTEVQGFRKQLMAGGPGAEVTALRLAAPHHTEQSLKKAGALLRASRSESDRSVYVQRNREFHLALYAPAGRARLVAMIDSLHSQGERYLRLKLEVPPYKRRSDDEHHQILEALRGGEVERAVQILEPHLLQTGEMLASYVALHLASSAKSDRQRGSKQKT